MPLLSHLVGIGLDADLPAAGTENSFYIATDTGICYVMESDQATWVERWRWEGTADGGLTISDGLTIQEMVRLSFGTWSSGAGAAMLFDGNDMRMNARNIGDGNWHWEGDLLPEVEETDELFDLGSEDAPWQDIHASGTVTLGDILPQDVDTHDIGADGDEFKKIYVNNLGTLTTQGDLLRQGASALERLAAVAAGALVGGDGTDVVATVPDRSIVCLAAGGYPTTTGGCSDVTKVQAASNDDYKVLDFDKDADEFAIFGPFALPANYDAGTFLCRGIHWTGETGWTAAETVRWAISIKILANDNADSVAYGTAINVDDIFITIGDIHLSGPSTAITPGGTAAGGGLCYIRIMRDISGDDGGGDARFISARFTYGVDAISDAD